MIWFGMTRTALAHHLRRLADDIETLNVSRAPPGDVVAINSWSLGTRTVPCLIGRPIGHPSIEDGKPACSSELFYLDLDTGIARSFSRWYRLGTEVDPEYWARRDWSDV